MEQGQQRAAEMEQCPTRRGLGNGAWSAWKVSGSLRAASQYL